MKLVETYYTKAGDIHTERGSRKVITCPSPNGFSSRLYVNNGDTATLLTAKHKTQIGAARWAFKILKGGRK